MDQTNPVVPNLAIHRIGFAKVYLHFSVILTLLLISGCIQPEPVSERIQLDSGWIEGNYHPASEIYSFKGIPYASAPTDSLRWKSPLPVEQWDDTLDASWYGNICMQFDPEPFMMWTTEFITPKMPMSEDCLNLNVWAPAGQTDDRRPVIMFIHGGGFTSGSGAVPVYNGENMAKKGVIFVTINYRVGIFGFLAHEWLTEESAHGSSGNYGLLDQIQALKWIQKNIEQFGGDPDNVTIAGQSAGSFSVNYLSVSPLAEGTFHQMIAQSGAAFLPSNRLGSGNTLEEMEQAGRRITDYFKVSNLSELRALRADTLMKVQMQFGPVIDGSVIPGHVYELYQNGEFHDVPVLTGWNEDEGLIFGQIMSSEAFSKSLHNNYKKFADELLSLFPAENDSEAARSQTEFEKLTTFGLQSWKWAGMMHRYGKSDAYLYHFSRDLPYSADQYNFGAFHTGEVPYAYATLEQSERPWTGWDIRLSDVMSDYWVSFARNGVPGVEGSPEWPAFDPISPKVLQFGDSIAVREVPMRAHLELLDSIFTERLN